MQNEGRVSLKKLGPSVSCPARLQLVKNTGDPLAFQCPSLSGAEVPDGESPPEFFELFRAPGILFHLARIGNQGIHSEWARVPFRLQRAAILRVIVLLQAAFEILGVTDVGLALGVEENIRAVASRQIRRFGSPSFTRIELSASSHPQKSREPLTNSGSLHLFRPEAAEMEP